MILYRRANHSSMDTERKMKQGRFEALLASHSGIVFRVVRTYCRHPEDQQDLAQEIKLQLWTAFAKYDESRSFSTWMYRISLNAAISWTRRTSIRSKHTADFAEVDEQSVSPEFDAEQQVLYQLIDGLDPMNRAVLLLYLDDFSNAEIGDVLGITAINAATKISRLKQRLREQAALNT